MVKTKRQKSRRRTRKGGMIRKAAQTMQRLTKEIFNSTAKDEGFKDKYSKKYNNLRLNENVNPNITEKNFSSHSASKVNSEKI